MNLLIVTATRGESPWFSETAAGIARVRASGVFITWVVVCPLRFVETIKAQFPEAVCVEETARGLYSAINEGVRSLARESWEWMSYINDDDSLTEGFARLCTIADRGGADIYYGDVCYIDKNSRLIGVASVCRYKSDLLPLFAQNLSPFTQQGSLVSRKWFERMGGFDTQLSHVADSHFWVRCLLEGAQATYVKGVVAHYRNRPGQLSNNVEVMNRESELVAALAAKSGCSKCRMILAKARFKLSNVFRILMRIRKVGFVSSKRMFSHGCTVVEGED